MATLVGNGLMSNNNNVFFFIFQLFTLFKSISKLTILRIILSLIDKSNLTYFQLIIYIHNYNVYILYL